MTLSNKVFDLLYGEAQNTDEAKELLVKEFFKLLEASEVEVRGQDRTYSDLADKERTDQMRDFVWALQEYHFSRDCDCDHPISLKLYSKGLHRVLPFVPIPRELDDFESTHEQTLERLDVSLYNLAIAAEDAKNNGQMLKNRDD